MITCKECKFWARSTDPNNVPESLGACNKGKFVYQNPYCLLEYNDDYLPIGDNTQKDAAYYWDAESYRADIVTGEDFGCIHAGLGFRYGRSDTLPALNPRPTDAEIQKLNKDYEGHYLHISADASAEPVFPIHDNEEPIRLKFNGVFKHVIHEKQSIPTGTGTGDTESEGS